jgi:hypothetical protein
MGGAALLTSVRADLKGMGASDSWIADLQSGAPAAHWTANWGAGATFEVYSVTPAEMAAQKATGGVYKYATNELWLDASFFTPAGAIKSIPTIIATLGPTRAGVLIQELFHAWFDLWAENQSTCPADFGEREELFSETVQGLVENFFRLYGKPDATIAREWPNVVASQQVPDLRWPAAGSTIPTLVGFLKTQGFDLTKAPKSAEQLASEAVTLGMPGMARQ